MLKKSACVGTGVENDVLSSLLLQAWRCALGDDKVIYLSGPITTGLKLVECVQNGFEIDDKLILRENSAALIETAKRLRRTLGEPVLEPATLSVPSWEQAEYLELWKKCIKNHARIVMFMPDWQYSVGCVTELIFAKANGVLTQKIDGSELTDQEVSTLIAQAKDRVNGFRQHPRLRPLHATLEAV